MIARANGLLTVMAKKNIANLAARAGEEQRFEEIREKNIVISLHEHPVLYLEDISQTDELDRSTN